LQDGKPGTGEGCTELFYQMEYDDRIIELLPPAILSLETVIGSI
jgi:hypothetical protein